MKTRIIFLRFFILCLVALLVSGCTKEQPEEKNTHTLTTVTIKIQADGKASVDGKINATRTDENSVGTAWK